MYNKAINAIGVGVAGMMLFNIVHVFTSAFVSSRSSRELWTGGLVTMGIVPFLVFAGLYLAYVRGRSVEPWRTVVFRKPILRVLWLTLVSMVILVFVLFIVPDVCRRVM